MQTKPRKPKVGKPETVNAKKPKMPPLVKALADQANVIEKHTAKPKPAPKVEEKKQHKSSVIKRPFSLPIPLFKFAQAEAKRIAKAEKKRPNISGYIASLIFAAKHAAATPTETK